MTSINLYHAFANTVQAAVADAVREGVLPAACAKIALAVEPPRDAAHGDLATNAAMILAKPAAMTPRTIADILAARLSAHADIDSIEIAGPGFINMRLTERFWHAQVLSVLERGEAYGRSALGEGRRVNVEFVSANPTGPMHVGHCRGAVVGDVLCRLLEAVGYLVTREYYLNDAGAQVDVLARSTYLRYREALGEEIGPIPEGWYPGDYLKPVGAALAASHGGALLGQPESVWLGPVKAFAIEAMVAAIHADLAQLGVAHDIFSSEKALLESGGVDAAVAALEARGYVYTGTLDPPKGKTADDWEARPLLLFKASAFGDDGDRPLKKSNGEWTYFGADLAYHWDKVQRADQLINIWGADGHTGAIKRMQAALEALTGRKDVLDVQLVQMVRLFRAGEPVKMSKRAGTYVTLRDVVDEVGKDVVRFMMLTRKSDSQLDFDFAKVREQSRENPVFYVQYAHARICSVRRKAGVAIRAVTPEALALLRAPEELALIRLMTQWPRVVETAAQAHEPHRIAFYLFDLAAGFHALWNRGNDDPALRFIVAGEDGLTQARLCLIEAVAQVIRNGLAVMGVEPVEEMN